MTHVSPLSEALVGRSRESDQIDAAIADLRQGRGQGLFISGEAGIGKSTLAKLVGAKAAEQGLSVYWGFCWEAGGAPAYWPWTQMLRALVADQKIAASAIETLGELLPEAVAGKPNEQSTETLQPDQARFLLLESARQLLEQIAREEPIVLIIEDLHAADNDSLQLLQFLCRHINAAPILFVGTFREVEARASASTDILWQIVRNAQQLQPARLVADDIREYLDTQGLSPEERARTGDLLAATEGNPLFLVELVEFLRRSGFVAGSSTRLPDSVQQVIRQQIALLPEQCRNLLAVAAVLGRTFEVADLAVINDIDADTASERLAPALDVGFVHVAREGQIRFAHVLHRDVLYQDLIKSERASLHLKFADHLRAGVTAGNVDNWTQLAAHLRAAGREHLPAAIDALQKAARRALERLAFDDAVNLLEKALAVSGEGPKYDPLERFELLIECANANLLTGNVESGHRYCKDAFAIARTVEDATLMSRAALSWGSAIVVARLDSELIAALQESLNALPSSDLVNRARVQARLAGAMQPALNPAEPMEMARDAIDLARKTDDPKVLYEVLRSAISALMDFAPVRERIVLNQEFEKLAAEYGDVPGQFRSNLRLMIDATEAGDRDMTDRAIDECVRIANRIGLPHYLWRAQSARAMQAIIDGRFASADALLDSADELAREVDDLEAKITLTLQRFTLMVEWDTEHSHSLEDIEARLQDAYDSGMSGAEFFITPFIATHTLGNSEETARQLTSNKLMIERAFAGGDRYSLGRIGELAIRGNNEALARRALDALAPFSDECSILGLMGSSWCGPVASAMGLIAAGIGELELADKQLITALEIATNMRSQPYMSRIQAALADVAEQRGDTAAATRYRDAASAIATDIELRSERIVNRDTTVSATEKVNSLPSLKKSGDVWAFAFAGEVTNVKNSKGIAMLSRLIAPPDKEFHVLDLSGSDASAASGDTGPQLDSAARSAYQTRVKDLQEELEEARELGDLGRGDGLQEELDFITAELSRAFGLGGRNRAGGDAERARVNVRRRLKDAIQRIGEKNSDAGRYLENTVKTGTYCKFSPM